MLKVLTWNGQLKYYIKNVGGGWYLRFNKNTNEIARIKRNNCMETNTMQKSEIKSKSKRKPVSSKMDSQNLCALEKKREINVKFQQYKSKSRSRK